MRSNALLLAASAAAAAAALSPSFDSPSDIAINNGVGRIFQRQAGQVITTGARGLGDGQGHPRLEINDLQANRPDLWSLYIRTMTQWKEASQDDTTGYFGISSIHGVPRTSWNGVEQCDTCGSADGYCTHDSVLFPTWHRCYLALFEQEFIKVALEVANSFDGEFGDRMRAAAQIIRIAYWDWAATPDQGVQTLPDSISGQQVTIAGPSGQETVDNPLFSYHFSDPSGMYYGPFTTWPETFRYPNSNEANASSQESLAINAFNSIQQSLQDQVYQLLSQCSDYLGFATDDATNNQCANSIEGIHNTIHTTSGGPGSDGVSGGHMTYLPLASFDPVFWLHHANIDRLFALWQTAHPTSYGASQQAPHSTWTIASGSTQDADSPLMPFRKSATEYWTTNDVRDWDNTFAYDYPEFLVTDGSQSAINNLINRLYGPSADETASSISARVARENSTESSSPGRDRDVNPSTRPDSTFVPYPTGSARTNGTKIQATKTSGVAQPTGTGINWTPPQRPIDPSFVAPNGSYYQYQCKVDTPRYAFNGSYIVYVFDGQPASNDTSTWLADKNFVGQLGILAGGEMENHGILSSGSVPVTRHLQKQVKAGKLPDMSEKYVVPYMKKNLNWRIVYQGAEVNPNQLQGYKASFFSGLLSPVLDGELPVLSNLLPHVDVTEGKAGGITQVVDAIGDTVENIGDAVGNTVGGLLGGLLGGGSGSQSSGYQGSEYQGSQYQGSEYQGSGDQGKGNAASPTSYVYQSKALQTPAASYVPQVHAPQEEMTTTVYVTQYTTYCPCKTGSAPEQSATAYSKPAGY